MWWHTRRNQISFLSAKRRSPFKSAGASVQSTTGSRGVRISDSNAGHTMFRGSVKGTGYPLHSPVSPSLPLPASPCAITFQMESTSTVAFRLARTVYCWIEVLCHTFFSSELYRGENSASRYGRVKPRKETIFNHWRGECVGFGPSLDAIENERTRVPRTTARSPITYQFPYLDIWVQWHCTCKCVAATCAR